ncbi:hypothetical protein [Spirosoma jeollabukense]
MKRKIAWSIPAEIGCSGVGKSGGQFVRSTHLLLGFIFNNLYAYNLRRFTSHAGTASGLTGGYLCR